MARRWFFPLVALFWLTMNVLLWRSEMGGARDAGALVPLALVWERILAAPDDSSLEIQRGGKKLGYCRWTPLVTESPTVGREGPDEPQEGLEGRIRRSATYTIDFDGNLRLPDSNQLLRFNWRGEFGPDRACRSFTLRVMNRLNTVDVKADFAAETVTFKTGGDSPFERAFTFRELRQPEALFTSLGLPFAGGLLEPAMSSLGLRSDQSIAAGLNWEARSDWMGIGQARARVYRLRARLFDQYKAEIVVSRVGEIMRLELPGGVVLANEALLTL